jgi:hypothetical protein
VVVGGVGGIIFIILLVYLTTSLSVLQAPDDFSPTNTAWNGMSNFVLGDRPLILQNLTSLPPNGQGFVLMEVGPSIAFTNIEARAVSSFVQSGGTLVIADDFGSGNTLLQGMGLSTRFTGSLLADPLFNFRNSWLVNIPRVEMSNVSSLAFNYATTLSVADAGAQTIGLSSDFSYIYPTQPGENISNTPHGPLPVLAKVPFGHGEVLLVSDASVFINSMLGRNGNSALMRDISIGIVLLDTSHLTVGPATRIRAFELGAYSILSLSEFKYTVVLLSLVGVMTYRFGVSTPREDDELKRVMEEHPEWDERKLKKLKEAMESRE